MLIMVLYQPKLAEIFATRPLGAEHWLVIISVAAVPAVINLICAVIKALVAPRVVYFKK